MEAISGEIMNLSLVTKSTLVLKNHLQLDQVKEHGAAIMSNQ